MATYSSTLSSALLQQWGVPAASEEERPTLNHADQSKKIGDKGKDKEKGQEAVDFSAPSVLDIIKGGPTEEPSALQQAVGNVTGSGSTGNEPNALQQAVADVTGSPFTTKTGINLGPGFDFSGINPIMGVAEDTYKRAEADYNKAREALETAFQNAPADIDYEKDPGINAARAAVKKAEEDLRAARAAYEEVGGIGHSYSFEDRASDVFKGAIGSTAASNVDAFRVFWEKGGSRREMRRAEEEATLADLDASIQRLQIQLNDLMRTTGGDASNPAVRQARERLQQEQDFRNRYINATGGVFNVDRLNAVTGEATDLADRMAVTSAQNIARAKEGLGGPGRAFVDVGVNGIQMAIDIIASAMTGGAVTPIAPLALRAFGGATMEARQGGGDIDQQLKYGAAVATVEALTESMFNGLAGIYGAGMADDVVESVIRRMASTDLGRTALRAIAGLGGEGIEELVAGGVNPALKSIYNGKSVGQNYAETDVVDILYEGLIGGILGFAGAGVSIATGQNVAKNTNLRIQDASLGDVNSQVNNAFDVLQGRVSPEQQAQRESAALEALQNNYGENIIDDILNGRLNNYDNVERTSPVTEEQLQARNVVREIIRNGRINNTTANEIARSPALREAFAYFTGISLDGLNTAQARAAIQSAARDSSYLNQRFQSQQARVQAADQARAEAEAEAARQAEGTQTAGTQAEGTPVTDTGPQRTPTQSYVRGMLLSYAADPKSVRIRDIVNNPEYREAFEQLFPGTKLDQRNSVAWDQVRRAAQSLQPGETATIENAEQTNNPVLDIIQTGEVQNETATPAVQETQETDTPAPAENSGTDNIQNGEVQGETAAPAVQEESETEAPAPAPEAGQTAGEQQTDQTQQTPPTPPAGPMFTPTEQTTAESTNGRGNVRERNMAMNLRDNEKAEADLRRAFEENRETYKQLTNAEVVEKANAIVGKGYEIAKQEIYRAIERAQGGMKLAPEYAVAGYHLANEMTRRGDVKAARELASSIAAELSAAGQLGQIGRVLLDMDPSVRILTVDKIQDKMNSALTRGQQRKISRKAAKFGKTLTAEGTTQAVNNAKAAAAESMLNAMESASQSEEGGQFNFADEAAKRVADSIKQQIKNSLAPAKPKNTLDTFVNYVKKFAHEKTGNLGRKSTPMTATQFLTEVVNNEDIMREVYEKAQAQFAGEDSSGYREFVQDYLNTPIGLDSSDSRNKIFTRAIAESAMATEENNARFVREQEALGVPRSEIADRIANDLIGKTGAEGAIADSIREAANNYVEGIIQSGDATSEVQVERVVNNVMRTIGERFRDLAVQGDATKASLREAIAGEIASTYALSSESAERIADTVANQYDSLLTEAIQEELEKRFAPKERQAIQVKEFAQQMTEAINLGAFNSEYAENAIKKLFGVEGKINIDPDLLNQYANAQTDADADAAMDAILQNIADQVPATFMDKFTALRYLNMLGNFKTQARNIGGNTLMMIATDTKLSIQALNEMALSAVTNGKYERQTSITTKAETRQQANQVFDDNVDDIKNGRKFSEASREILQIIQDKRKIFDSKILEGARNLTNWAMDEGDVIFMRHTFNRVYAGWMNAHGITDINTATPEQQSRAYEFAKKEAQEATFHDSNKVSDFVSRIGRGNNTPAVVNVITEGISPFRKTPANVAVRAIEYSPVGLAKTIADAAGIKNGETSAADVVNDLSKTVTGTALAIAGFFLAAAGRARASGNDDDDDLNYFQKQRGASDYSVKIGDSYVALSQFAPMAIPFFMGIKLQELMEKTDDPFSMDSIGDILGIISDPMLEMSMLSGVNDMLNSISSLNGDTDAVPSLVTNAAISYLTQGLSNTFIGQLEQASEENRQTIYTDTKSENASELDKFIASGGQRQLGKFSAKIPGWDYNQEDYIDAWGRTQSNGNLGERLFNSLLNPTYLTDDRSTRVDDELERLHTENRDVEGFPEVLPEKRGRNQPIGDGIVMTPDEYRQFSIDSGQMKLELVSDFMDSTEYQNLDDRTRAEVISNLYQFAEDRALARVREQYGVENQSDWDKLMNGTYEADGTEKRPALEEGNIGEFITFDTAAKGAAKDNDYDALESVFGGFAGLDENTQAVLAAKGGDVGRYARLSIGKGTEGEDGFVPALAAENVGEFAQFEDSAKDAINSGDFITLGDIFKNWGDLDANTQAVLAAQDNTVGHYATLATGTESPDPSKSIPALDTSNIGEYAQFETGLKNAAKSGDYSAYDALVKQFSSLDPNTQEVLTRRNPASMNGIMEYVDAGSGAGTYFKLKDEVGDAQWELETTGEGGKVKMLALANADIPEEEKADLMNSDALGMSKNRAAAWSVLGDALGFTVRDVYDWFDDADWSYNTKTGEYEADEKLSPLEVAAAISRNPDIPEAQKPVVFKAFYELLHGNGKPQYDQWVDKRGRPYTYQSEISYLKRTGYLYGKAAAGQPEEKQNPKTKKK